MRSLPEPQLRPNFPKSGNIDSLISSHLIGLNNYRNRNGPTFVPVLQHASATGAPSPRSCRNVAGAAKLADPVAPLHPCRDPASAVDIPRNNDLLCLSRGCWMVVAGVCFSVHILCPRTDSSSWFFSRSVAFGTLRPSRCEDVGPVDVRKVQQVHPRLQ